MVAKHRRKKRETKTRRPKNKESNTGEGGPAILAKVTPRSMGGKGSPEMNPQTQPTFFSVMVVELRQGLVYFRPVSYH